MDLQLLAAASGTRLRDAPAVLGAPWERASVPRADPVDGGEVLLSPTLLDAPFLAGGRRASAVSCGQHCTSVFLPALLQAVDPQVTLDTGGRKLTLSGQALGSLCRLGRAYRDAADAGQLSATLAARNPNAELCALAHEAFPDGTGMVPIPGLLARFTVLPRQPGKRADDPPEFGDEDSEGGGGAEGADGGTTGPGDSGQVFYAKAYYPAGWRSDPAADVPGRANDVLVAAAGGAFHTQQGAVGGRQLAPPPNLDAVVVVAPTVPRPCAVGISLIVKPPRPWVAGLSDAAAALPLPIGPAAAPLDLVLAAGPASEQAAADAAAATGTSGPGAAAGERALEEEEAVPSSSVSGIGAFTAQHPSTLRRRGQVVAGRVALNFVTLPVINQAAPAMLRLPEPSRATRGAAAGAGTRAVGGGRGVDHGAAASAAAASHGAQAPIVTLSGEHLFGAALTDSAAGPVAESLIDLVKAAVQAREREEAFLLVSEVGLPALAGLNADGAPSGSPLSLTRGASAAGTVAPAHTERRGSAGSSSVPLGQAEDERIDLLLPTLHLKRGFGGPDMPHGVLVRFAVYSAPALAPAAATSAAFPAPAAAAARPGRGAAVATAASIPPPPAATDPLAGAKLLGQSDTVRGWFTCAYDEHLVHVMHAVDRMTGTTQAATKAASSAGGPGSGGTTVLGSRFGGGSVMSAAASGLFGPSGGGASSRKDAEDEDEDEEEEDDGDDEGVVGRYSATVSCALPDLSAITGGSPRGSGSQSDDIPEAVESLYRQVLAGEVPIDSLGLASVTAAPTGAHAGLAGAGGQGGVASAAATSFSFEEQFEAAVRARGGGGSGALLLRPEVSVNGGRDFIAGAPQSVITAFSPVFSHVTPPCGPGAGGYALKIRGLGLVDAPNLQVRFTRLPGPEGASSGAEAGTSVVARAAFVDSSTLSVMVPELPAPIPAAPLSPKGSAGSGSPRAAGASAPTPAPVAVGHASFRVEVSTDGGATFSSGPHMQLVAHWGGDVHASLAAPQSVILVPTGGQMLQLPLQARTMPCFDAWTQPVPQRAEAEGAADASPPSGAASSTTWVPPLALVGHPIYGLGSHVTCRMWQGTLTASTAASDSTGPGLAIQRSPSSPSMADRANSFRGAAAAVSSTGPVMSAAVASFRPPEGCKWHAGALPVHASTTQADCLRVALPPLGTLMPLAAPTVLEAPASSRQGSASTSHVPTWMPDSRQAVAELAIWGTPLRTRLQLRYFGAWQ
jgi:hypothetical protein